MIPPTHPYRTAILRLEHDAAIARMQARQQGSDDPCADEIRQRLLADAKDCDRGAAALRKLGVEV